MTRKARSSSRNMIRKRIFNARPDIIDFRDRMYVPTLVEVPQERKLDDYLQAGPPILDQGSEGACTGFGLAAVANYLLRTRDVYPDKKEVSPKMLYTMARRYDEWPGEDYSGSSARGAMKGWHKHGICTEEVWPYRAGQNDVVLSDLRAKDAETRPLGAYFRVNHRDLVAMHAAITEVGILYATASVHEGWDEVDEDGIIDLSSKTLGGHAFAIVAYDWKGFWIQNSWGDGWGRKGFGHLSYADWLANGTDVWVARLGVPVELLSMNAQAVARSASAGGRENYSQAALRPHIISLGNDGKLRPTGTFGTGEKDLDEIIEVDIPRITKSWRRKRILLYAHGGLVDESTATQLVADYLEPLLSHEIYPISFIWHSDYLSTLTNILKEALSRRRDEGVLDAGKDFLLDRLDDGLEILARPLTGKAEWDEMRENAEYATIKKQGGARLLITKLAALVRKNSDMEVHIAGHSAGSIFHGPLVELLTTPMNATIPNGGLKGERGLGVTIESASLWAPACHMDVFHQAYAPAISTKRIKRFAIYTLTDKAEQDDNCGRIYNKSLLYLVSNAFEKRARIPFIRDGEPLLGMAKFIGKDSTLQQLIEHKRVNWIQSPQSVSEPKSTATSHGAFDNDRATVKSTMTFILGDKPKDKKTITFSRSRASYREQMRKLA